MSTLDSSRIEHLYRACQQRCWEPARAIAPFLFRTRTAGLSQGSTKGDFGSAVFCAIRIVGESCSECRRKSHGRKKARRSALVNQNQRLPVASTAASKSACCAREKNSILNFLNFAQG